MGRAGCRQIAQLRDISIHPSRVGWDLASDLLHHMHNIFQSTHPVWDGTGFYLTPDGEIMISIHPSRVGWDENDYS